MGAFGRECAVGANAFGWPLGRRSAVGSLHACMQMALQRHTRSVGVGPSLSAASGAANFLAFYSRSLSLHHTYISFPFHSFISHLTLLWSLLAPTLSFLYTPTVKVVIPGGLSHLLRFATFLSSDLFHLHRFPHTHSQDRASHFVTKQRTVKNRSSESLFPFQSSAGQSVHLTRERLFNFLLQNTFVKHGALDSNGPVSHIAGKTEIVPRPIIHKVTQARSQCPCFDYFRIRQGISKTPATNNLPPA